MVYPTVPITSLSEDAQKLHASARSSLTLDRDWLQPHANRMSAYGRGARKLDPEFEPGPELLAAIGELTASGYAWHSHSNVFGLLPVDPDIYTVAQGEGPWIVKVARVRRPGMRVSDDGALLAVLDGAGLTTRTDTGFGTPELHVEVRVPGARDIEHDTAYAASITLQLPTFPQIHGSEMTFWGVAEAVHLYPLGTEPTLLDDRTHEPIDEPVWCDSEHCQEGSGRGPHVFAPYLPPAVELSRAVLCIEARLRAPQNKEKK